MKKAQALPISAGMPVLSVTALSILVCAFFGALRCDAFSYSSKFAGIELRLVEAGGTPVPQLATRRQPYILLDPLQKKAIGFSGCNSFFGGYDLDGASLKFGPLGATRMFCEDVSDDVEVRFMQALDKTSGYKISDGELLLVDDEGR